ncbi:hypothetical protein LMH87_009714 [Akanthomyces muscarius]|uniref:Uncharacterized protein n=1 Tax=Akanthomyces muscarius TaxID=2231603 RepID=A0A9W8QDI1_AKAMU|nr:hypothetical protein LMH87_009714 [Akanthomyces muscarius]KAJ4153217.1 hypothetical protein LMH87_009714 [Akanthomyces muscarius]
MGTTRKILIAGPGPSLCTSETRITYYGMDRGRSRYVTLGVASVPRVFSCRKKRPPGPQRHTVIVRSNANGSEMHCSATAVYSCIISAITVRRVKGNYTNRQR